MYCHWRDQWRFKVSLCVCDKVGSNVVTRIKNCIYCQNGLSSSKFKWSIGNIWLWSIKMYKNYFVIYLEKYIVWTLKIVLSDKGYLTCSENCSGWLHMVLHGTLNEGVNNIVCWYLCVFSEWKTGLNKTQKKSFSKDKVWSFWLCCHATYKE